MIACEHTQPQWMVHSVVLCESPVTSLRSWWCLQPGGRGTGLVLALSLISLAAISLFFFFFFLSSLSHLVSLHSHPGLLISLLQGPSLTDTFVDICLRWLQVQTPKHRARILSNSFCLCGCCPYLSRCWGLMPTALGQFFMWCSCLWMPGMVPSCAAVLVGLC